MSDTWWLSSEPPYQDQPCLLTVPEDLEGGLYQFFLEPTDSQESKHYQQIIIM